MIKKEIPIKHFFMLRHGQSESNAAKIYSGQIDTPLTELGKEQAEQTAKRVDFLEVKPKVIIHSHLQRARDTAAPCGRILGAKMHEDPKWAEQHYGDWQGLPHDEVRHLREAGIDPPNGETNVEFISRIMAALKKTLNEYDTPPLIVCHGGCFRAISTYFGGKVRGSQNCTLHEFIPTLDETKKFPWHVFSYICESGDRTAVVDYDE